MESGEPRIDYTTGHAAHEYIGDLIGLRMTLYNMAIENEPNFISKARSVVALMSVFRLGTNDYDSHSGCLIALRDLLQEVNSPDFSRQYVMERYTPKNNEQLSQVVLNSWKDTGELDGRYDPAKVEGEFEAAFTRDASNETRVFSRRVISFVPWIRNEIITAADTISAGKKDSKVLSISDSLANFRKNHKSPVQKTEGNKL